MVPEDGVPLVRRLSGLWAVLPRLRGPLSVASSLVGLAAALVWVVGLFDGTWQTIVQGTFVCLTAATFIGLSCYLQLELTRVRRRGLRARQLVKAQDEFAMVSEHLSRAAVGLADPDRGLTEHELIEQGTAACQRLAAAFSVVTSAPCRATVKQIYTREDGSKGSKTGGTVDTRVAVKDLFRSHAARSLPPDHIDWADENTHFEELLLSTEDFWSCDDLRSLYASGYRNSRIQRSGCSGRLAL